MAVWPLMPRLQVVEFTGLVFPGRETTAHVQMLLAVGRWSSAGLLYVSSDQVDANSLLQLGLLGHLPRRGGVVVTQILGNERTWTCRMLTRRVWQLGRGCLASLSLSLCVLESIDVCCSFMCRRFGRRSRLESGQSASLLAVLSRWPISEPRPRNRSPSAGPSCSTPQRAPPRHSLAPLRVHWGPPPRLAFCPSSLLLSGARPGPRRPRGLLTPVSTS